MRGFTRIVNLAYFPKPILIAVSACCSGAASAILLHLVFSTWAWGSHFTIYYDDKMNIFELVKSTFQVNLIIFISTIIIRSYLTLVLSSLTRYLVLLSGINPTMIIFPTRLPTLFHSCAVDLNDGKLLFPTQLIVFLDKNTDSYWHAETTKTNTLRARAMQCMYDWSEGTKIIVYIVYIVCITYVGNWLKSISICFTDNTCLR